MTCVFRILIAYLLCTPWVGAFSLACAQITGGTTAGSDVTARSDIGPAATVRDIVGNRQVNLRYFELDGKTNTIRLNALALTAVVDAETGAGSMGVSVEIGKIEFGNDGGRRYVAVEGDLGIGSIRLELDQPSCNPVLTGTTILQDPGDAKEVPVKLVFTDKETGKAHTLFEMSQDTGLVQHLEGASWPEGSGTGEATTLPKYLRRQEATIPVSGSYEKTTRESAAPLLQRYKSVPGGVTLEGDGKGIEDVKTAKYDGATNSILLNDNLTYECPVSRYEMREILSAIAKDGRAGVSLSGGHIVYGALVEDSNITLAIRLVDMLLGHIAFGGRHENYFAGYRLANGYVAEEHQGPRAGNVCVYFRFGDYSFRQAGNAYELASSHVTVTLVPVKAGITAEDGGALPDFDAIESGAVSRQFERNVQHISDNIDYYMKERLLRMVNCYGEAAAFARGLKRNGIDLEALAASM